MDVFSNTWWCEPWLNNTGSHHHWRDFHSASSQWTFPRLNWVPGSDRHVLCNWVKCTYISCSFSSLSTCTMITILFCLGTGWRHRKNPPKIVIQTQSNNYQWCSSGPSANSRTKLLTSTSLDLRPVTPPVGLRTEAWGTGDSVVYWTCFSSPHINLHPLDHKYYQIIN